MIRREGFFAFHASLYNIILYITKSPGKYYTEYREIFERSLGANVLTSPRQLHRRYPPFYFINAKRDERDE